MAEAWLKVVHSAIPPSALAATSASSQQADNSRASLGWSSLMRAFEAPEKVDDNKKWSFGLYGSNDVFRRIFDVDQTMDLDNQNATDLFNDKGDSDTLESASPSNERKVSNSAEAVYEGEQNDRGERHGFGKLSSKDYTCEGSFQNGEFSGLGQGSSGPKKSSISASTGRERGMALGSKVKMAIFTSGSSWTTSRLA